MTGRYDQSELNVYGAEDDQEMDSILDALERADQVPGPPPALPKQPARAGSTGARTCEKAVYVDQADARLALSSIKEKAAKKGKALGRAMRVYPCDVCDGWHLTQKPVRGRPKPWDRDPDWVRPNGTAHLQQRTAEVIARARGRRS